MKAGDYSVIDFFMRKKTNKKDVAFDVYIIYINASTNKRSSIMTERQVEYGKNMDVFLMENGRPFTILDSIDIKITDGVAIRVCLVQDCETFIQSLKLQKQLVLAFDKHETAQINSYNMVWFYNDENAGKEEKVIGDGNLLPKLFDIIGSLKVEKEKVNKVMIMVQKALSVQY